MNDQAQDQALALPVAAQRASTGTLWRAVAASTCMHTPTVAGRTSIHTCTTAVRSS